MAWNKRARIQVSPPGQRTYKGRTYDSKVEMLYAQRLDLLVKAGKVLDFCEQPKVHLAGDFWYKPDFFVVEPEVAYYVDVKGMITDHFRNIIKAWPARSGFPLHIVKYKKGGFETIDIIHGD